VLALVGSSTLVTALVGLGAFGLFLLLIVLYIRRQQHEAGRDNRAEPGNDGFGSGKSRFRTAFEAGRKAYRERSDEP
jgi:hypothetical protein